MPRFPKPLLRGDVIAVTAPSSGVHGVELERLDLVLWHLRSLGYVPLEGRCLRTQHKDASADAAARARELGEFLVHPDVAAVFPPWGGELATEVLDHVDFDALCTVQPKWVLGYSDVSTILMPLTLISDWATAHGANLMDLAPAQTDPLVTAVFDVLGANWRLPVVQASSTRHQTRWTPFTERVDAPFDLAEPTRWQRLDGASGDVTFAGRLIGGCLDTVAWLAGSRYGDVPAFVRRNRPDGTIVYLENVEMPPTAVVRCLVSLKRQRWFDGLAGLLLGRSDAPQPESPDRLSYVEALHSALRDVRCPILYDVDIGHRPPQFTLVNGARAVVTYSDGRGTLTQHAT